MRRGGGAGLALLAVDRWWIAVQLDWWTDTMLHALALRVQSVPHAEQTLRFWIRTMASGLLDTSEKIFSRKLRVLRKTTPTRRTPTKKSWRRSRNREGLFLETRARDTGEGRARGLYG